MGGFGQAHDGGHVFRAGAQAALLFAAEDDRTELGLLVGVEQTDALGTEDFVAAEGAEVGFELGNLQGMWPRAWTAST